MIDRTVERVIKVPRVRLFDCQRLIFRIGEEPVWRDMDLDPDLFPVYPLPPLTRKYYTFGDYKIEINPGDTINNVIRRISGCLGGMERSYLHTIIFRKSGELEIQIETI